MSCAPNGAGLQRQGENTRAVAQHKRQNPTRRDGGRTEQHHDAPLERGKKFAGVQVDFQEGVDEHNSWRQGEGDAKQRRVPKHDEGFQVVVKRVVRRQQGFLFGLHQAVLPLRRLLGHQVFLLHAHDAGLDAAGQRLEAGHHQLVEVAQEHTDEQNGGQLRLQFAQAVVVVAALVGAQDGDVLFQKRNVKQ